MENAKLSQSVIFLEECINNRSKIINHDEFVNFLKEFCSMCSTNSLEPVIRIKPYGAECMYCNKYITGRNLASAVEIESGSFICSLRCLRDFKCLKPKSLRKNTGDSNCSTSTVEDESCISRKGNGSCGLF